MGTEEDSGEVVAIDWLVCVMRGRQRESRGGERSVWRFGMLRELEEISPMLFIGGSGLFVIERVKCLLKVSVARGAFIIVRELIEALIFFIE